MQRALVNSGELNLRFDLPQEFCTAAWHALNEPIEAVMAATGQPDYYGANSPLRNVHLTEPLVRSLGAIMYHAVYSKTKRTTMPRRRFLTTNQIFRPRSNKRPSSGGFCYFNFATNSSICAGVPTLETATSPSIRLTRPASTLPEPISIISVTPCSFIHVTDSRQRTRPVI